MGNWYSNDYQTIINQQKRRINELETENTQLKKQKLTLSHTQTSRAHLMEWIDKQLDDPANNITLMPDKMERKLKAQMFGMFLNLLDYVLETTTIRFMGQEVVLDIRSKQ